MGNFAKAGYNNVVRVLVTGATGYIGGRLVPALIAAGHEVRCFVRDPAVIEGRFESVDVAKGDVFDRDALRSAMDGCEAAYYLIHSMSDDRQDFSQRDREAAEGFGTVARDVGVGRIIYLGGLGQDEHGGKLSKHLKSRQEVGNLLRAGGVPVTEFRAAIIVGSGSISFEMLRYLTERLPVMITPKWVSTRCQPIAVRDVISYLAAALAYPESTGRIIEIGGADVLSYRDMMQEYARVRGLRRHMIVVPFFSPGLSARWVHFVTPIPSSIARPLVEGLFNEVVVHDPSARDIFPTIEPIGYEEALQRALDRYKTLGPATTWFDAYDVKALPGEFTGSQQGMLIDRRERDSTASGRQLFDVFTTLGGTKGWLYADWLWQLRGTMDRAVGGIGTRRGRRSQTELRPGDAVDFWRVEKYQPYTLLRLRAEMKLPGYAWLQFEALPKDDGTASLRQTAFFEPLGIFGFLYWYCVLPFHEFIFGNMATRIALEAEMAESSERTVGPAQSNQRKPGLGATIFAGFVASFAMDLVQIAFSSTQRNREADDLDEETEAIAYVVKRIGQVVPGTLLKDHPAAAGRIVHYVFGAGFAAAYIRLREIWPSLGAANGFAFGVGLWFASDVLLIPLAHIGRSWFRYSAVDRVNAFAAHVAYGMALETIRARSTAKSREPDEYDLRDNRNYRSTQLPAHHRHGLQGSAEMHRRNRA